MDVNIALGLLAALVVVTSQPYNAEGRSICRKDLRKLQKRSGEGAVLIEGYEVAPKDEGRGADCVEYEAAVLSPTPALQTTTKNKVPYMATPIRTPQKPSKTQCWVYYGKPVKIYLPMRNMPTLPNSQGSRVSSGPYTGRVNSVNTQPRVVCGKVQMTMRSFPKGLQDHLNGSRGKQDNKRYEAVKPIGRPVMAIQVSTSGSSSFYNFLKSHQRVLAAQKPRGSSASRCV